MTQSRRLGAAAPEHSVAVANRALLARLRLEESRQEVEVQAAADLRRLPRLAAEAAARRARRSLTHSTNRRRGRLGENITEPCVPPKLEPRVLKN